MVESVFAQPIFMEYILPFLLVFTLAFAILERTKVLGDGKKQINAIMSLVMALILIGFPFARDVVVKLIPFFAVSLVVLFVFMLLYGFVSGKEKDVLHAGTKVALLIILSLAVITAVLWATGAWDTILDALFNSKNTSAIWMNVLLIAIIGGALAVVLSTKDK